MMGTDTLTMTRIDTAIQAGEASAIEEFVDVLQNVDIAKVKFTIYDAKRRAS